jgi:hypothetical protein
MLQLYKQAKKIRNLRWVVVIVFLSLVFLQKCRDVLDAIKGVFMY